MQPPLKLVNRVIRGNIVINSKTPKSAVVERIGSDSAVFARQLCAVTRGVFFTCDTGNDYWQLPIARKELARAVRLLDPKADFLRSNVTLQGNPPLSKEFQGENR